MADDIARQLSEALDAAARTAIGDNRAAPPFDPLQPVQRFEAQRTTAGSRPARARRRLAPILVAACVLGVVALGAGVAAWWPHRSAPTAAVTAAGAARPVHVSVLETPGATYGVGMPIVAWFDVPPTDATAFQRATTVTVDGRVADGSWYFEHSTRAGVSVEAHYRLAGYWPAHATIGLALPVRGLSAGRGLEFGNDVTLTMQTGAAQIATVDATTLQMTVTSDGRTVGTYPVSLGAAATPTGRGTKVIMSKGSDISMVGPGYDFEHVQYAMRLTDGGEYLHSAPWNVANLGKRSTSNGCTNLAPADAQELYALLQVGDVVRYPNATGPMMSVGSGLGDWNVPWSSWQQGGSLH